MNKQYGNGKSYTRDAEVESVGKGNSAQTKKKVSHDFRDIRRILGGAQHISGEVHRPNSYGASS